MLVTADPAICYRHLQAQLGAENFVFYYVRAHEAKTLTHMGDCKGSPLLGDY
ncbi:MAG: hypothetical protein ACI81P_002328 [Neolewinella sp.]|jgi:hypothetical protein